MRHELIKRPSLRRSARNIRLGSAVGDIARMGATTHEREPNRGRGLVNLAALIAVIGGAVWLNTGTAHAATPVNAPLAVVNANAYAARLLSMDEQVQWLRALHGQDLPVRCQTFNADTPDAFNVCAPMVDNDNSPIVGDVEEDGSARYADGSQYDADTATWN
jgi:hypothetical protein